EDGIRDKLVTGVQTCALPISLAPSEPTAAQASPATPAPLPEAPASVNVHLELGGRQVQLTLRDRDEGRLLERLATVLERFSLTRSEERRVGKECRSRWAPVQQ